MVPGVTPPRLQDSTAEFHIHLPSTRKLLRRLTYSYWEPLPAAEEERNDITVLSHSVRNDTLAFSRNKESPPGRIWSSAVWSDSKELLGERIHCADICRETTRTPERTSRCWERGQSCIQLYKHKGSGGIRKQSLSKNTANKTYVNWSSRLCSNGEKERDGLVTMGFRDRGGRRALSAAQTLPCWSQSWASTSESSCSASPNSSPFLPGVRGWNHIQKWTLSLTFYRRNDDKWRPSQK